MLLSGPCLGRRTGTIGEVVCSVLHTLLRTVNRYADSRGRRTVTCSPREAMTTFVSFLRLKRLRIPAKKPNVIKQSKGFGLLFESQFLLNTLIVGNIWKLHHGSCRIACHHQQCPGFRHSANGRYQSPHPAVAALLQTSALSMIAFPACPQFLPLRAFFVVTQIRASGTSTAWSRNVSHHAILHPYLSVSMPHLTRSVTPFRTPQASRAPSTNAKPSIGGNTPQLLRLSHSVPGARASSQPVVVPTTSAFTSTTQRLGWHLLPLPCTLR